MLVVMEHGDFHPLAKRTLDVETLRSLDIFQIDAAERRLQARNNFYEFFGIALFDLDIENIDAGKFFEETGFAFHHRFAG